MTPDPEDLRSVLRAARHSGKDDGDPQIRAAREAADDSLLAELAAERSADEIISRDLKSTPSPPGLEDRLIAAMREARRARPGPVAVPVAVQVRLTRRSWIGWAAAASLVGGAGAWWWTASQGTRFDDLLARLADISKKGVTLSLMSMDRNEVGTWLAQAAAPRTTSLPAALDELPRKGCHLYDIDGRPVSLECFLLPGMRQLHLFTTASKALRGAPAEGAARVTTVNGLTSGAWTRDGRTMMLLSEETPGTITSLLANV